MATSVLRVAGADLGKATAKLLTARLEGEHLSLEHAEVIAHQGRPLEAFADWYQRADIASCAALGVTGLSAAEVLAPAVTGLPEDACLAAALTLTGQRGPVNLVSIGARGYAVVVRDERGQVEVLENDKCSSGTGETMIKMAARFGLSLEAADRLARGAQTEIAITARCSVFAKSELTHFANQGKPTDALLKGYFASIAASAAALLTRVRVPGPILLIGGAAMLGTVVDALAGALGQPVIVPEQARTLEALGAAVLAGEQARAGAVAALPRTAAALLSPRAVRFRRLAPARASAARVRRLVAPQARPGAAAEPCVLGLDLGSTGSKAVLTGLTTGELVLDVYDRTRGNPVDAARRLVTTLLAQGRLDVRAIGVTGSGREAVATVLRASFPEAAGRIVVLNEIVAHATAAMRCDPGGGDSLSVVEIGGQDAKFIQIAGGQIVESGMNKACSAGTGSFLEEQALLYGVTDIGDFGRLASAAAAPPDLGQMCTVFVAEAAAEARAEGFELPELFAGFQYSVVHNYLGRVMEQRTFARTIFFQGKPAESESLAWALAAVTGREVLVPANPGAMGAWGIGLCAIAELGVLPGPGFDLAALLGAEVVARSEFQCRDKGCATLCTIDRSTVQIGVERRTVFSGGACPKYEISTAARPKLPADAPSAFDEHAALLEALCAGPATGPVVGVPVVGALVGRLAWLTGLLRGLGRTPRLLASDARTLARGEARCMSYDACAPVKLAHALVDADGTDQVLMPRVLGHCDGDGTTGRTCPMEQAMPEMAAAALQARRRPVTVLRPLLDFASPAGLEAALAETVQQLGAAPRALPGALRAATAAQLAWQRGLVDIGQRTLAWAAAQQVPVVMLAGMPHVIHEPTINAELPRLLRENGVLALPVDCLPIPAQTPVMPKVAWADARRALRAALAARGRGDVYPIWLSAFGCGPASFTEQLFAALMEGHPHAVLESDGHGGAAGYVTRVQAFLHAVRRHPRTASTPPPARLALLEPAPDASLAPGDGPLLLLGLSDRVSGIIAAAYRAHGVAAQASPPASAETLALARRDCSGKECLPYQLIWGSFRQHLEAQPPRGRLNLVQVTGQGMCRNCLFSTKDRLSLDRLGLADRVGVRHLRMAPELGWSFLSRCFGGMVLWDLLRQLRAYLRPLERVAGAVDRIYQLHAEELDEQLARPLQSGLGELALTADLRALAGRAADAFADAAPQRPRPGLRTVLLSGDVYVRLDDFASDGLERRLAERGLRVLLEPLSVLGDYFAEESMGELLGLSTEPGAAFRARHAMRLTRRVLTGPARRRHPWLAAIPSAPTLVRMARPLLDREPRGEAPVTLGSVLHAWQHRHCDGVVLASPWGCGPALIAEALLRHQRQIPMLAVYTDGSPIDERRLNAFAFRLRRQPSRVVV